MAKVMQAKERDFDAIEPRISFTDMAEERKLLVIEICREAYSKLCFAHLINQDLSHLLLAHFKQGACLDLIRKFSFL